ncbi:hypothetical protein BDD12DRAFT_857702, partial [Trichophaea hybrida]
MLCTNGFLMHYSLSALREVLQVTHSIYILSLFMLSFFMGEVEIIFLALPVGTFCILALKLLPYAIFSSY